MLPAPRHDLFQRLRAAQDWVTTLENTDRLGWDGMQELRAAQAEVDRLRAELRGYTHDDKA